MCLIYNTVLFAELSTRLYDIQNRSVRLKFSGVLMCAVYVCNIA